MKLILILACLLVVANPFPLKPAMAQPPKYVKPIPHTAVKVEKRGGGLEVIEPKEEEEMARRQGGWSGSYVGVNAGAGFGATAGTNMVVPLGGDRSGKSQ